MSRRTPVGLLLLAAFLCAGIAAQAAEVQRFAVVNLEKVFREYRKSRIAEDAFKQQAEVYRNYFVKQQGLLVQLRKQAEQLQEEARNPALSEADRSKAGADAVVKAREVAAKEAELKLYAAERLRTMRDAEQKKREEVFADIYKEIDRRAAGGGVHFRARFVGEDDERAADGAAFSGLLRSDGGRDPRVEPHDVGGGEKGGRTRGRPQPGEKTEPQPE